MFNVCPECGIYSGVHQMTDFNQWIKDNAHKTQPPMTILDNTNLSVEETVDGIAEWIHGKCC